MATSELVRVLPKGVFRSLRHAPRWIEPRLRKSSAFRAELVIGLCLAGSLLSGPPRAGAQEREHRWPAATPPIPVVVQADPARHHHPLLPPDPDSSSTRAGRFGRTVPVTLLGSAVGVGGGALTGAIGAGTLRGYDADYGTLAIGVAVGAVIGGTLLSSTAAHYFGDYRGRPSFGRSFGGALVGILPGGLLAAGLARGTGDLGNVLVGFAFGQGLTTALFTAW